MLTKSRTSPAGRALPATGHPQLDHFEPKSTGKPLLPRIWKWIKHGTHAVRLDSKVVTAVLIMAATAPADIRAQSLGGQAAAQISPESLLAYYLSTHPELRTDAAFARDWTTTTKCMVWTALSDDEFRGPAFLKAGTAELAALQPPTASTFALRLERNLTAYDGTKQEFGLNTLPLGAVVPVRIADFGGEAGGSNFRRGCAPTSGLFPLRYDLKFDNASVANGMPMLPEQAEAYARSRTNQAGRRENGVIVEVRFTIAPDGPPRRINLIGVTGLIVPLVAHIVDVVVEDATPQRRVSYRVSEAKLRAGETEAASAREDARVASAAKPLTMDVLAEQFRSERAGAKVGTDPVRLFVDVAWAGELNGPVDQKRFPLTGKPYQFGDYSVRFVNAAEVAALPPNPALYPSFRSNFQLRSALAFVPVGASDDPLKGGRVVVAHIVSVDTVSNDDRPERLIATPTTSTPAPWRGAEPDARLASSFEVLGIRTGMTMAEVSRIAKSELRQVMQFNEATGILRSPPAECEFDIPADGSSPPVGRKCLVGTFLRATNGAGWTLAKFRLTQTVAAKQRRPMDEALLAKYSSPDLVQSYPGRVDTSVMQAIPTYAVGWGARLTSERPEADSVPFPLHPLELVAEEWRGVAVMQLTVTDWAALNATSAAKPAPAKREPEVAAPKF